jgi:hypothetical protein
MKISRFEDIEAWQEARKLVKLVYEAIRKNLEFQKDSRLVGQIQAAAVSSMEMPAQLNSLRTKGSITRFLMNEVDFYSVVKICNGQKPDRMCRYK